jgi:hypothetical protein
MAKTLLNGINDVLKKVGFITGESGELTSLTDSARQVEIDIAKRHWNLAIEELYSESRIPHPQEVTTTTITLVTDQREYSLPSDLVQIRFPITFATDQHEVREYPGGYEQMRDDQTDPSNYTGRPNYAVISPISGDLRFDRAPTSDENGDGYEVLYDKDVSLDDKDDTVPFSDAVFRAMVEVVGEDWRQERRSKSDKARRKKYLAQAAKYLTQKQPLDTWGPIRA